MKLLSDFEALVQRVVEEHRKYFPKVLLKLKILVCGTHVSNLSKFKQKSPAKFGVKTSLDKKNERDLEIRKQRNVLQRVVEEHRRYFPKVSV